ncbi:hypothetical protein SNARM312S_05167 [Streptomyces narbonensis]
MPKAHSTARAADRYTPGWAVRTTAVASATPTSVPPKRATERAYVCVKSGRITMTEAIGAQYPWPKGSAVPRR